MSALIQLNHGRYQGLLTNFFAKSVSGIDHFTGPDTTAYSHLAIGSIIASPVHPPHVNHDRVANTSQNRRQTVATGLGKEGDVVGSCKFDLYRCQSLRAKSGSPFRA